MLYFFLRSGKGPEGEILATVKKGDFIVTVTTTGELQARNSEDILGPSGLRNAGVWQVKIQDLIAEGTVVKPGDYIATLDRSELSGKLKDLESEVQKIESQYIKTKLDTTLELRNSRDEQINLRYGMEERKITLEQSKYEPPATIRQAEIELEKSSRNFDQAVKNYKIKREQAGARMSEVSVALDQQKRKLQQIIDILDHFTINAPRAGMVIYIRDWNGKKLGVGSTISPWAPAVATLPDLTQMISKTYVNEIDISKVKMDQVVEIGIDAFTNKKYSGKIIQVANVGEQLPNSDAKVFEVRVLLQQTDTTLRPSMTTSNIIITQKLKEVLSLPLEAIHTIEQMSFVYLKNGFITVKQQVEIGSINDNEAVILKGVEEGDRIYLSVPANSEEIEMVLLKNEKGKSD